MDSEPTRDDDIIDLVLVTQENLGDNVSVSEYFESCDHTLVGLNIRAQTRITENKIKVTSFKRADYETIRQTFD